MANAFVPDEKRRHQYIPVNEEPPDYDVVSGRTNSGAGPSDPSRTNRSRGSGHRSNRSTARAPGTGEPDGADQDDVDALPSGTGEGQGEDSGQHAPDHRADSEDSSIHEFHELDLESETPKEPVFIRITKRIHRITLRVDQVLYTYVNATIMRYLYGAILGIFVISLVYIFGGSIPKITIPKRYREDALRAYINEESSAANIRQFTDEFVTAHAKDRGGPTGLDNLQAAYWAHDEFVKLGVARNAVDQYFVYFPEPVPDGMSLEIRDSRGETYAADVTGDDGGPRALIAHGMPGNVTGPLIYANLASANDIKWLKESGVDVSGSIVLFRRSSTVSLAEQILAVQDAGAVGCVAFSTRPNFEETKKLVFPDGPFAPDNVASNGDAALTWVQPGDVLTPGFPSFEVTKSIEPSESNALPSIPALSISAVDANHFLSFLNGHGVKIGAEWDTNGLSAAEIYSGAITQDAPQVSLYNNLEQDPKHPIYNVLSEIDGDESDQVLIVGTSLSSPSTVATLLEVSRIFADLVTKYAWKPRRSVIFAIWDGSEKNLLGSTEWAETQIKSLRHQGLAYINLNNAASLSHNMQIRASPSLSDALSQAMQHVQNPAGNATIAEDHNLSMLSSNAEPLGFSDSTPFETHVGLAVADIGYPDSGLYSECLNSAKCIDDHIDPDFRNHLVLAKTFAMIILELVDEKFIPLDVHAYARSIEAGITALSKKHMDLDFGGDLNRVLQILDQATDLTMQWMNEWHDAYMQNKEIEAPTWALKRSNWNYAVTSFHRNLLRSAAWTTWFAHPVYGPAQQVDGDGKRAWMFPHIEDAIASSGDSGENSNKAQGMIEILGQTLLEAAQALRQS